jgi:hypothetical protein
VIYSTFPPIADSSKCRPWKAFTGGRTSFATPHAGVTRCDAVRAQAWHLAGLSTSGAPFELTVEAQASCHLVEPYTAGELTRITPGHSNPNHRPDPLPRPAIYALIEARAATLSDSLCRPLNHYTSWLHLLGSRGRHNRDHHGLAVLSKTSEAVWVLPCLTWRCI